MVFIAKDRGAIKVMQRKLEAKAISDAKRKKWEAVRLRELWAMHAI
jgi:hypothetical protein